MSHTEAVRWVIRAPATLPGVLGGTIHIRRMIVPDFAEKVDLIRTLKRAAAIE